MTVYLTVSDPLSSRNAFKFNDISMQKIIEWEIQKILFKINDIRFALDYSRKILIGENGALTN